MVSTMRRVRKNVSVIVDIKDETVIVMVDGIRASKAEFTMDNTQIMVTDVSTEDEYQKCGYGRLLFDALKLISEQKKMPLILWSSDGAIKFYEKIGLIHLNDIEIQKRVLFGNIKTEELSKRIDNDDFIYLPQSLKRKPIIYL